MQQHLQRQPLRQRCLWRPVVGGTTDRNLRLTAQEVEVEVEVEVVALKPVWRLGSPPCDRDSRDTAYFRHSVTSDQLDSTS